MTRRRPGATAAGVAVAAVLAACSSGGEGDPAASPPTAATTTTTTVAPPPSSSSPATAGYRLELRGFGPVRVGMTVQEAGAALGTRLAPVIEPPDEECATYGPESGFDGVGFLVARGVVARTDVTAGSTQTPEGVAIGQSEDEAQRRYGGRLAVGDHDYLVGGRYLTLIPTAPADEGFRLVIETDGRKVTALRAGRLPEVEYSEGCL
ncbi:MAG TPA: hypothetical protein VM242_01780 [Acidimicrobiales bacterium]|jgi:hypothetical protein|nr:hypothetical protein [Acidimicrobiales bacterium]